MSYKTFMLILYTMLVVEQVKPEFVSKEPHSFESRLQIAYNALDKAPLIDGHNDLPMNIRQVLENHLVDFPFDQNLTELEPWSSRTTCDTDIPRIRQGKMGGAFWSTFVPCSSQYKNALTQALEQIDITKRLVNKYSDDMELVTTSQGILDAFNKGKIVSLIGVEGGHMIDSSLGALRVLYNAGARYLTLTHMCNTPWADASTAEQDGTMEFGGLTDWGEKVVLEMNRLGMLVDLAHVAKPTMEDALAISRAPVIFSHSNARGVCNITRNVPDHILQQLIEKDGIVMVNFLPDFVSCGDTATMQQLIDQINYIRDMTSEDHVGIGTDFEGIGTSTEGLEDVSKFPVLFAELLLHGWTEDSLQKLAGLNLIRVFGKVEEVRDSLSYEEPWDMFIPAEELDGHDSCTNFWP